jgi:hypothetical protein
VKESGTEFVALIPGDTRSVELVHLPIYLVVDGVENAIVLLYSKQPSHLPPFRRLLLGDNGERHLSLVPADLTDVGHAPDSPFTLDYVVRCHFMRGFIDRGFPEVFVLDDLMDGSENVFLIGLVNVGECIRFVYGFAILFAGTENHGTDCDKRQDEEQEPSRAFLCIGMITVTHSAKEFLFHYESIISSGCNVKAGMGKRGKWMVSITACTYYYSGTGGCAMIDRET